LGIINPILPPYDPLEWAQAPFAEKARMVCRAWALQGYGTPLAVYLVYAIKIGLYIGGWVFFCSFTPGAGRLNSISTWWLTPVAFQKAILWSMLFEGVGLGCGSGPLTGRYFPPLGGALYFLRPGTTKLPALPGAPVIGGFRRTWLDVALYAGNNLLLVIALVSPAPTQPAMVAIAVLLVILGLTDKTLFLIARGEHYWTTLVVFVLASNFIPGAKAVWAALWFWAGFSKLNHHFPAVVCVMTSNSPFTRFAWLRKLMYQRYPDDLRPSRLASIAHAGILLEFSIPIVLLTGRGGTVTLVGMILMLGLHTYITSNVPMGVPLEWNVIMVYGAFFLFWQNATVSVFDMRPPVALFLAVMLLAVPLLGNLVPSRVPFLMAMRYYAGNWAYSIWLFRGESHIKLARMKMTSPWVYDQLDRLYDRATGVAIVGKVMGFRLMHLHGRALSELVPRAVDRFEDYQWVDGEVVAGLVLGWNFGEGHLHNEQLLGEIQAQCGFDEGELRCIFVESQPFGKSTLSYRIADASSGRLEAGEVQVRDLLNRQPWGEEASRPATVSLGDQPLPHHAG
jgi:hypothetical protein